MPNAKCQSVAFDIRHWPFAIPDVSPALVDCQGKRLGYAPPMPHRICAFCLAALALALAGPMPMAAPAAIDPALFSGLSWRNIGPFRGGRVSAVTGVVGQPGVFYMGLPLGGVWKTTS